MLALPHFSAIKTTALGNQPCTGLRIQKQLGHLSYILHLDLIPACQRGENRGWHEQLERISELTSEDRERIRVKVHLPQRASLAFQSQFFELTMAKLKSFHSCAHVHDLTDLVEAVPVCLHNQASTNLVSRSLLPAEANLTDPKDPRVCRVEI